MHQTRTSRPPSSGLHPRRWWALAIALTLLAAACGDGDDAAPTEADAPAAEPPANGTDEAEAEPEAAAESGGTLRYAYYIGPSRFDPHRSTVGQDIRLFAPVYDRLVHYDRTGDFIGGLATEWEFSDDGLALELALREGVVFHDGEPFDAEAVRANIERGKTLEGSSVASDLADIDSVEVVDEHRVVLRLTQPSAVLPGLLSSRAGAMVSPGAFDNEDLDFMPVGAGPYRVSEHRVDDMIVYERFADHWDDAYGGPDRIEVRVLGDEATRLNALRSGEVDVAFLTGSQVPDAEAAGFTVDARPTLTYQVVYLNRAQAEFDNQLVRQAMHHAIDREAFVEVVLQGAGLPAVQPFPEGYFAHNPDFPADHYEYDPDRARELLAEAGVPDGFQFEMLVPAVTDRIVAAEVIQQMLGTVGITPVIRQIEPVQAGDIFFAQEDGDGMMSQWGGRADPQITMDLQFTADGFLNAGDHTTDRFEELSAQAKAALDPDERAAILHEMVAEAVDQAFTLILAHDFIVHGYHDGVQGYELLAGGEMDFRSMAVQ
jgi:peptide/nickel transport system substrate-binding protein